MSQHPPGVPIQLVVGLLVPVLGCYAAFAQQDPSAIGAREDPYFQLELVASETILLPCEPPRVYSLCTASGYPGCPSPPDYPSLRVHEAILRATRGESPWKRVSVVWEHPMLVDWDGRPEPVAIDLFIRPGTPRNPLVGPTPPYAFPEPGHYRVCVSTWAEIFGRWTGQGPRPREIVHTTPPVSSNAVDFEIALPPGEEEAWQYVRSHGWLSESTTHEGLAEEWRWGHTPDACPPDEEAEEFIRVFPGSRYADHLRLLLAKVALTRYCNQTHAMYISSAPRWVLERVVSLLEGIQLRGFSRADMALALLAAYYAHLCMRPEAESAWQQLQDLPYPSPLKRGGLPDEPYPPRSPWYLDHRE